MLLFVSITVTIRLTQKMTNIALPRIAKLINTFRLIPFLLETCFSSEFIFENFTVVITNMLNDPMLSIFTIGVFTIRYVKCKVCKIG